MKRLPAAMLGVDANLVVRYLTRDHPKQSARARKLIDAGDIYVGITVMLEAERVLRSVYAYQPGDVCRALRAFAGLPGVSVEDKALVATALDRVERGMDFVDALHPFHDEQRIGPGPKRVGRNRPAVEAVGEGWGRRPRPQLLN